MSAGRQEDLGTSNPTAALRCNAWAGHGQDAAQHRLLNAPPFCVELPPEPAEDEICIQRIGRFDIATGRSKDRATLPLTFGPQTQPGFSSAALLCLPPSSAPPPPPPHALPMASFPQLLGLPVLPAEELPTASLIGLPAPPAEELPLPLLMVPQFGATPLPACSMPPPPQLSCLQPLQPSHSLSHPFLSPALAVMAQTMQESLGYVRNIPFAPSMLLAAPLTSQCSLPQTQCGTTPSIWSALQAAPPAATPPERKRPRAYVSLGNAARDTKRKAADNPWWCSCGVADTKGSGRRWHTEACPMLKWLNGQLGDPAINTELVGDTGTTREGRKARRVGTGVRGRWEVDNIEG